MTRTEEFLWAQLWHCVTEIREEEENPSDCWRPVLDALRALDRIEIELLIHEERNP